VRRTARPLILPSRTDRHRQLVGDLRPV